MVVDPAEQRFRASIVFVLEYLLPQLRERRMRGAVIQALSDTLGLTPPSTARLIETVLHSRRTPGQPLIRDFLALVGSGVTGAYFANAELRGEPALVRTDPELSFSWVGASPGEGVPARGFSVRWRGFFLPRQKAPHVFYVRTEGAVRLAVKLGGAERVLIDRAAGAAGSARVEELRSDPIALDADQLVELQIEYRNQGGPASFGLQVGTGPRVKQAVATTDLYPADGLSSFAPVEQSYRRLHKAAMILTGFGTTDAQLEWITGTPPALDLDALPMEAGAGPDPVALFTRWRRLAALYALRKKLPRSNVDLFDVFRASSLDEAIERIVLSTGWDRAVVKAFTGTEAPGLGSPTEASEEPLILRLARAVELQRRAGVAPATLFAWAGATPDADMATTIVQAVKARYDEKRWLEVARTLNDGLRAERRDALVAYLLPRMAEQKVRNRSQLFEYFLIDVDMNPCMMTSRIRQAIGTVQTFFQRCLMNLEPDVPPRLIDDNDWKWLKSYRVWEANRKVFLYPENWIEPELRDDKSPLFAQLERTILQQEINKDNVEAAFASYLEGLNEISRLDVRGVYFEPRERSRAARFVERRKPTGLQPWEPPPMSWDNGTYHVFARTFNGPHVWYYRRLENARTWTPWEKIDADIEGDHLVPVIFQRRLHLFWSAFREANKPTPPLESPKDSQNKAPSKLGKDWEVSLAYTVYDRGRWSRKRMSTGGVRDVMRLFTPRKDAVDTDGSTALRPGDYTLRATVSGNPARLHLDVYRRKVNGVRTAQRGVS
ncbi:MAG TPA: neuraminidase-like domain-containing protein, partial [Kofleriaceae bacterium]